MKNVLNTSVALIVLFSAFVASAADVAKTGSWTRQEYKISGSWSIVEEDGRLQIRFSDDFKTKSGPDLKIFLSRDALDSLTGKNAIDDSVLIAPLRSARGGQSYPIPPEIHLSEFKSIIIHCEKYSKLWGGSSL